MIGERVRVARARAKMTMADLGEVVGVSPQMIKKYEHNESMPNSSGLLAMCRSLDVSLEWLMDITPLDFHSTETAPQGRHAKYWVREAVAELRELGCLKQEA